MKLSIAICDDNVITLNEETELLKSVLDDRKIEYSIDQFTQPRDLCNSDKYYEIIILDVEMDELNGIQTAKILKMKNENCLFFFATNYEKYLDDALNQRAFRFWTKPLDLRKLDYAIKCAISEVNALKYNITITVNNKKQQILLQHIIYIYMENKRLHIVTTKGEIVTFDTIKTIYDQIKDIAYFSETCRGYYVNLNFVTKYNRDIVTCVYDNKTYEICISRRKYNLFHKAFIDWIGGK